MKTLIPEEDSVMKIVKLLALITIVVVMMCGGCAQESDMSATREWAFET